MAALARALSRASGTNVDVETLKTIAIFCGVGLFASLLFATYGLDLSPGFSDLRAGPLVRRRAVSMTSRDSSSRLAIGLRIMTCLSFFIAAMAIVACK